MSGFDFPNLTVQGRLVPDVVPDTPGGAAGSTPQGADAFELGVEIRGVWVPFYRRRSADGLLADIERLEMSQPAPAPEPAPGQPAPPVTPPEG